MNAAPKPSQVGGNPLNGFYAYRNTFDHDVHWVDIPRELTFYHTTDPYSDNHMRADSLVQKGQNTAKPVESKSGPGYWGQEQQQSAHGLNTHGLEALSAAALSASPQTRVVSHQQQEQRFNPPDMISTPPTALAVSSPYTLEPEQPTQSPIDPKLVTARALEAVMQMGNASDNDKLSMQNTDKENELLERDAERRMSSLLRSLSQSSGHWASQRSGSGEGS